MATCRSNFIVSIESECLTAVPDNPDGAPEVVGLFFDHLSRLAPTLSAHGGVFTPYGKVYCDCGHIEMAAIECDSPYVAPLIVERMQTLAAEAVARMAADGVRLVLANNNHSGLLANGGATWGHHENYHVDQHPSSFTDEILPFLVTRMFGGAGGVHHPSGNFLASVRSVFMQTASGGGTTDGRAIHSLARDEHHTGPGSGHYRYHLILGDGHRSQFNLALQLGATALAVRAATSDPQLRRELALLRNDFSADWIATLREVNVLVRGSRPLAVHPLVIKTQRLYLEGARRWAARLDDPPEWIPRLLGDWEQTLVALEQVDRLWLSRRLDAFAKYEFYSAVLAEAGRSFAGLRKSPEGFHELALLDQSYHEFCNPASAFSQLETAGALDHRVGPRIEPGAEPEPYVPEVNTRARARARFIRDHGGQSQFVVDWSYIHDGRTHRLLRLYDPFAQELPEWVTFPAIDPRLQQQQQRQTQLLEEIFQICNRGRLDHAWFLVRRAETESRLAGLPIPPELVRQKAWLSARCGYLDGIPLLQGLNNGQPAGLRDITDYCAVYRFTGLLPDLEQMEPWVRAGQRLLETDPAASRDKELAAIFRGHAAAALTRHGRLEEALSLLASALEPSARGATSVPTQAHLLAVLGEAYRRKDQPREARETLQEAMRLQREHGLEGQLGYGTLLSLAKSERLPARALRWLSQAEEIQQRNGDHVARTAALLIEARVCGDPRRAEEDLTQVKQHRDRLPALGQCRLLSRILSHWDTWTSRGVAENAGDEFWGL